MTFRLEDNKIRRHQNQKIGSKGHQGQKTVRPEDSNISKQDQNTFSEDYKTRRQHDQMTTRPV